MHTSVAAAWQFLESVDYRQDLEAVEKVCREQFPNLTYSRDFPVANIWIVNDADDRTFEEIEQIMEKAAIAREESL